MDENEKKFVAEAAKKLKKLNDAVNEFLVDFEPRYETLVKIRDTEYKKLIDAGRFKYSEEDIAFNYTAELVGMCNMNKIRRIRWMITNCEVIIRDMFEDFKEQEPDLVNPEDEKID
jgi:hypothetical protein